MVLFRSSQGKYDIIIAGMSITEERKEKVNFTTGYMTDGARFAVLKNSGLANQILLVWLKLISQCRWKRTSCCRSTNRCNGW